MHPLKVEHIITQPNGPDVFKSFCRLKHFSDPPPLLTHSAAESDLHQRDGEGIGDCDLVNADNYVADNDVDDAADYE